MKINIYQINGERDTDWVKFEGLKRLAFIQRRKTALVVSSIYDMVYSGDVDCYSLDQVYRAFKSEPLVDYLSRPIAVSDVIEVVDSPVVVGVIDYLNTDSSKKFTDFLEYTLELKALREDNVEFEAHDYTGLRIPLVEKGFYFVDRFGLEKVDFDVSKVPNGEEGKKSLDEQIEGCADRVEFGENGNFNVFEKEAVK